MELQQYLTMLRERWASALLTAILVLGAVVAATLLQTPTYQATTRLFVQTQTGSNVADLNSGVNFASQQITTYADLARSPLVLDSVIDELSLEVSAEDLAKDISTTVPADTLILEVTATSEDSAGSASIANATAASLQNVVSQLETNGDSPTVELTIISPALTPDSAASPNIPRNVALGVMLAILAGIGVAVARALGDNRVRTSHDIEKLSERPLIASIPASRDAKHLPLVAAQHPHSLQAEAYRDLRTNLQFTGLTGNSRSVLVTSSLPGEGKSSSAINLAHVLAQAGNRTLLVDADLRRPSAATYLGLEGSAGLTTVLIGEAEIADVAQPADEAHLEVLTSGPIPPNPSELLGSPAMESLLSDALSEYDYVVLDTAPLLAVTDAAVLSQIVGGTLVIAQSERVKKPQLRAALEKLEAVDARVLGVVLNRVPNRVRDAYSYKYNYQSEPSSRTAQGEAVEPSRPRKTPHHQEDRRLEVPGTHSATTKPGKRRAHSPKDGDHPSATARPWPRTSEDDGRHL